MLETLHPGGVRARSYSAEVVELINRDGCKITVEADVLRLILRGHTE